MHAVPLDLILIDIIFGWEENFNHEDRRHVPKICMVQEFPTDHFSSLARRQSSLVSYYRPLNVRLSHIRLLEQWSMSQYLA